MATKTVVFNNAYATFASGVLAGDAVVNLSAGQGARFPLTAGQITYLTFIKSDGSLEIVKCTDRVVDALTVVRAQDGTAAIAYSAGDRVECRPCNSAIQDLVQKNDDNTMAGNNTFTGNTTQAAGIFLTGVISPAQFTSDQNDLAPSGFAAASSVRISTDASRNFTGLAGGATGRTVCIENIGSFNAVLKTESASSSAANRFTLNADITIGPNQCAVLKYDATTSRWRAIAVSTAVATPIPIAVRQAIQYGPVTGSPAVSDLIPQSQVGNTLAAGITLKFSTLATLLSVANGFNADGSPNNLNWVASADVTVANLTASVTNYIWVDTVAQSAGFVAVADAVQRGGTIPVTNNLYTFDTIGTKMYLGNGSTASQSNRLIVAECDTNGTVVTAIRCRAYQRRYRSGFTTPLPAVTTRTVKNHNIGPGPIKSDLTIECVTAEGNFSVGDQLRLPSLATSDNYGRPLALAVNRSTIALSTGSTAAFFMLSSTSGTIIIPAAAYWKYEMEAAGYLTAERD